jgi:hypothetical protein
MFLTEVLEKREIHIFRLVDFSCAAGSCCYPLTPFQCRGLGKRVATPPLPQCANWRATGKRYPFFTLFSYVLCSQDKNNVILSFRN